MRTPISTVRKIRALHAEGGSYYEIAKKVGVRWETVRAWIRRDAGLCGRCGEANSNHKIWCVNCLFVEKLKRNK